MGMVQDVKRFVTAEWGGKPEPGQDATPETARLFHCTDCNETFVSVDELGSCSRCERPLENVPTERDLGIV